MAHAVSRGGRPESIAPALPARHFLELAIRAVEAGYPSRPVELIPGVWVKASSVVDAFAEAAQQHYGVERAPQSFSSEIAERIRAYTDAA